MSQCMGFVCLKILLVVKLFFQQSNNYTILNQTCTSKVCCTNKSLTFTMSPKKIWWKICETSITSKKKKKRTMSKSNEVTSVHAVQLDWKCDSHYSDLNATQRPYYYMTLRITYKLWTRSMQEIRRGTRSNEAMDVLINVNGNNQWTITVLMILGRKSLKHTLVDWKKKVELLISITT